MTVAVPFHTQVPAQVHPARGGGPRPLVVVLHGQGMRPESFARHYRALLELDAHLAFPRGIYPLEVGGSSGPGKRRVGYGWYVYDGDQQRFAAALDQGTAHLAALLDSLERSLAVDRDRIALVGFSQGAYLAYVSAIRLASRLAAFVGCAARFKHEAVIDQLEHARRFPILHLHGRDDPAVSLAAAEASLATLVARGWQVEIEPFDGGHLLGIPQVERIRDWLARTLRV